MFNKIRNSLDGRKSYLVSGIIFIVGGLKALGYEIPDEVVVMLLGVLGGTLRAGISKIE